MGREKKKDCEAPLPACPPLPLEVWIDILGYLTDKAHLPTSWQSCRRVNRLLKTAAEKAYLYGRIPKCKVHLQIGHRRIPPRQGNFVERHRSVSVPLRFDKMSPDGQRVYFCDPDMSPPPHHRGDLDDFAGDARVVAECRRSGSMALAIGRQAHGISTYEPMLNIPEGEIPGIAMEIDYERRIVSYLWKPLLSTFLCNAHDESPYVFYGKHGKQIPGRVIRGI
ncbi:hypothetical protein PFICI_11175 [Pestalotiopsis fici W106-1]|uniref:F-box domain-containing protein n=1 Tax=Pestalotiopsis fici (strain W106-1 / CGMCC3.15140) TaxID=1229662 RepID=W3WWQ5_PESFW|nr:uncharacterized protein PFICI_11175 [Pestalotiopsis fici W106-1]ETS77301.1 hypothetical protein PFICI_11175 [Pestalotiopsis fici W106-1]